MRTAAIIGIGVYYPEIEEHNSNFKEITFLQEDGSPQQKSSAEIIKSFHAITNISQRRIAPTEYNKR